MSRIPNPGAALILGENIKWLEKSEKHFPPEFLLGMAEARSDVTTAPPGDDEDTDGCWLEQYDAGREIARAALGLE